MNPNHERPLWLLDFDGVINAVVRKPDSSIWTDWQPTTAVTGTGVRYPVWYAPAVVSLLRDMHDLGVEIIWLSDWFGDAAQFADLLGLPDLAWQGPVPGEGFGDWWKLPAAQHAAGETRPLLWTDDDLHWHRTAKTWATSRNGPTEVLVPEEMTGLTPRRVREARAFLTRYASATDK